MKKRLKEMETEAAALRDMQAKAEKEMSTVQGIIKSPIVPCFIGIFLQSLDLQVNVCMKHVGMEDCAQFLLALSDGAGACQVFYLLYRQLFCFVSEVFVISGRFEQSCQYFPVVERDTKIYMLYRI